MKNIEEIARLFSNGQFEETADHLADDIEWHIYEEKMQLSGKPQVLEFCKSISEYFKSLTTKFQMFGIIADHNKVAIYGKAEFIRDSQTVNTVHSCDIYEFNANSKIEKVYSYCNSNRPNTEEN